MDWNQFKTSLQDDSRQLHRFLPPASDELIRKASERLGAMPVILRSMLECFNGAKLYNYYGPSYSLFGLTPEQPLNPLEWSPHWTIDSYTPKWRMAGRVSREQDWVFGISFNDELFVLHADGTVGLFDNAVGQWECHFESVDSLVDEVVRRAEVSIKEMEND